ncbi:MAG: hypothetical protein JRN15_07930, partial [Nitrososphaerota archaeon]|nr:hypothetical protein [Nitrososphaerota archaeon]
MTTNPDERTEVLTDQKSVMNRVLKFFSNASAGIDILTESIAPPRSDGSEESKRVADAYFEIKKKGGRLRVLTKIDERNMAFLKELMKNVQLRHLDDLKGNFALSENEYMSSPSSAEFGLNAMAITVIYSNARHLFEQHKDLFERFWSRAIPAEQRFREIEEGVVSPKMEIITEPSRVQKLFLELIDHAKNEILIILPTPNAFHREERIGAIDAIQAAASDRGVKVNVITPDPVIQETLDAMGRNIEAKVGRKLLEHKRTLEAKTPDTVTILVIDRSMSLFVEQKDDAELDFDKAIGVATYSTRNSTVKANVRLFERVWEEIDLREMEEVLVEKERRSRRAAELLQDILAHDIRNYNQLSLSSAELLKDKLDESTKLLSKCITTIDTIITATGEGSELSNRSQKLKSDLSLNIKALVDANRLNHNILKAVDGSSNLVDRAKRLGRIVGQTDIEIHPVDLKDTLQKSIDLIKKSHPRRSINLSSSLKIGARVLADDLLEEAFTNILSNSVNYTETDEVPVEIEAEEVEEGIETERKSYWKIVFVDHGKGIPDNLKDKIFTRYLQTATGAGLGLSIVHALVVERYFGCFGVVD